MSLFDTFFDTAVPALLDTFFGVSATYTPALTDTVLTENVSCNVIIEHDTEIALSDYDASAIETGITIEALFSDVATPQTDSTFLIDGTTYTVKRILENDKTFVKMAVTKKVWAT